MVNVAVTALPALGVTGLGDTWKVKPLGSPETVNVTGELNPLVGETSICRVPTVP
jgi:hypothetical protein